ncbi:Rab family GTPase [Alkalimarinus coralli]|uniref:Rab family GTPase n=1 Tax=Alkalimarinus coralli TaxID=2935863 RepID=UPI00202B080C|nr:Rab family GTPase [Alkalimarinus coralli]
MIAKKVCMVGPFAVGKTSLVRRYVESIFSDTYLTTIGVKISKKTVDAYDGQVQLMIWDIEGVDVFTELKPSYLRGASGVLLVLDGTRPASVDMAEELSKLLAEQLPGVPVVGLLNKSDLTYEWKLGDSDMKGIEKLGITLIKTSAKTGHNVELAFDTIVEKMGLGSGVPEST